MYSTSCVCPVAFRLFRSNLVFRVGNIFLKTLDMDEENRKMLSSDENTSRRKHFLFRNPSLTKVEKRMNVKWRKGWKGVPINFCNGKGAYTFTNGAQSETD